LVAIVILAIRPRHSRSTNPSKRATSTRYPSLPRSSGRITVAQVARFDEKTAKHLDQVSILTGFAWVTDGDTLKIKNSQVRLFGIDAPELNHPYGKKAKWALHALCKGHTIRAEITEKDEYGRTVARCYLPDGRDLSAEMVKQGLALDWPKFSGGLYQELETSDARKRLYLADARQKGRMHLWERLEAKQSNP
jgi:endonuclease YncB( thermonuclease family)